MPAIPVAARPQLSVPVPTQQGIFERGDRIYLTTPVSLITPSEQQIEEYAFSNAVKAKAPNDNIVWLQGRYVEADRANANGAQWRANELAIKSLTPMLMPVTVMHDPRTAVGTIADVKHLTPERDNVPRPRIDTVLALWGHRFPEAVHEAAMNAEAGTLMQSMECFSPWYECSECSALFHKLPGGAEQASWCSHLRESNPSAGYVAGANAQTSNASRILGDVCFTGTGLIFGTRGARGAYSEAYLESFEDEVASFHQAAHVATASTTSGSEQRMSLVQIEQSELDTLRRERDEARAQAAEEKATAEREKAELTTKVEQTEATAATEKARADAAEAKVTSLEETANQATLKDTRWKALGSGFTAKLGDFTRGRLEEQAGKLNDEDWENRLKELEEVTAVKRDSTDGTPPPAPQDESANQGGTFSLEEIAKSGGLIGGSGSAAPALPSDAERGAVVGSLASAFKPTPKS
jgi:hypothetical protein